MKRDYEFYKKRDSWLTRKQYEQMESWKRGEGPHPSETFEGQVEMVFICLLASIRQLIDKTFEKRGILP